MDKKKLGEEISNQHQQREKLKKRYGELKKEMIKIEKKLHHPIHTYEMFLHNGEKYIQFGRDLAYPLPLASGIIHQCKKESLKEGNQMVGMVLQIPSIIPKKKKKKPSEQAKTSQRAKPKKVTTKKK